MSSKQYYVYIMTNPSQSTLYTGITNDLKKRVYEHKEKVKEGFTKQYNVVKLVYYEQFDGPTAAIKREKQIKGGSRREKVELINSFNKEWCDLSDLI
jgi:putative endonuclease